MAPSTKQRGAAPSSPKILFAGTGHFASTILEGLLNYGQIGLVISRPLIDNRQSPVGALSLKKQLNVVYPKRIELLSAEIKLLSPDIMVVADYGQIIPQSILDIPSFGCLNIHPSLLPKYRGPAPIQQAILNGDKTTGSTIIKMDSQMDHGPILAQASIQCDGAETSSSLEKKLAKLSLSLLQGNLQKYLNGEVELKPQDHRQATRHGFITRANGQLTAEMELEEIMRKWRALQPWPGVWLYRKIRGQNKRIKLMEISIDETVGVTRPLDSFFNKDNLAWQIRDGALNIKRLQVEGGRIITGSEFIRGYSDLIVA